MWLHCQGWAKRSRREAISSVACRRAPYDRESVATSPLGVGIVGCGRAAERLHLPALSGVTGLEVRALCDRDSERLARASQRLPSARTYERSTELIDDPSVDVVAICLPTESHADAATAALGAGKHVLVEKPLASTILDADRMVARAATSSSIATVGFNLRAHRLVRQARHIVQSGQLGPIEAVRSIWTTTVTDDDLAPWRRRRATGGGVLMEIATHHVDLWRFLTGADVERLSVETRSDTVDDQSATLIGRLTSGALVSGVFSQQTSAVNEIELYGRANSLRFSLYDSSSLHIAPAGSMPVNFVGRLQRMGGIITRAPATMLAARHGGDFLNSYRNQWIALRDSIQEGAVPLSSWEDGRQCLRALCSARLSDHTNE